ncbi:MAG: putative zinc-binding metallopeptidase [Candidatus Aminicenantes bacterium]
MSGRTIQTLVQSWETVRCELLNTRISDLRLRIEGSPVEPYVHRLYRELEAKKIRFRPKVYLTDGWGCPDRTPVIGIPFYLADRRLTTLEEEQSGDIEDARSIMMLLRHEAGHSVNYAYRLWRRPSWVEIFGPFSRPYRDVFRPDRMSRHYVRHISAHPYGRTYAQKHPDEDFAETFAVWLTPRSSWRRRYRHWPAIRKLFYVNHLMKEIRRVNPPRGVKERFFRPVEKMNWLLAEHYGKEAERFRRAARGYVDDRLREVFPTVRGDALRPASALFRKHHDRLLGRIIQWSLLTEREGQTILRKLEVRSAALKLSYRPGKEGEKLLDILSLAVGLAMDYAYTGRLTG